MSIDNFPTEILERILNLLSLKDLESCRLVNRRWYDLSRVVLDLRWRKTCQADFPEASSEARRKSQYKLSWEQLHRSLSLWPHMSEAKITGQSKPLAKLKNWKGGDDSKRQFMVLDNGLIGTPIYSNKKKLNEDKVETVGDVWLYKYDIKPNNNTKELSPTKKKPKPNEDEVYTTKELLKVLDSDSGPSNKKQKLDENTKATEKSAKNEKLSDKVNTENHTESMEICENESSLDIDKKPTVDKDTDSCKTTEKTEAKSAKTRKRKAKPKTDEIVTNAVNNEATTTKRGRGRPKTAEIVTNATTNKRGRPKTAEIVTDAVKTEASNTKKGKGEQKEDQTETVTGKDMQKEVQIDDTSKKEVQSDGTAKTETKKGMRTRSANKKTTAQNSSESVTNKKVMAQNTSEPAETPNENTMNESGSVNSEDDKVFSKKGQAKNIQKQIKDIQKQIKNKEIEKKNIEIENKEIEKKNIEIESIKFEELAENVEKHADNIEKKIKNIQKQIKTNEIETKNIENETNNLGIETKNLEKLYKNIEKQVKNKKGQAKNKKSTAKNDNKNKTSTAKNETSTVKNENEEKSIDDTLNKENMVKNNNYIQNVNQNTVNTNASPLKSSSNAKETRGKSTSNNMEIDGKSTSNAQETGRKSTSNNQETDRKSTSNKHIKNDTEDDDFDTNLVERKKKKVLLKKQKKSDNLNDLMNIPCCNSVLYLDIDTLAERHLETYEFEFNKYAETDDMVVFRSCQGASCKLVIGYKVEGKPTKMHTVGDMRMHGTHYTEFFIVNDAVYYQDDENEILTKVSPKTDTEGEKVPEIKPMTKFSVKNDESLKKYHNDKMTIIAIVQANENTVNVLTDDTTLSDKNLFTYRKVYMGNAGMIYSLNILTEEFSTLDSFSGYHDTEDRRVVHDRLGMHGFDFADERIFAWLSKFIALTKLKKTVVHRHDKMVIIGNTMKTLFIHSNPFKCSGKKLYLYTAKPTLKIDLKKLDNVQFDKEISPRLNKISQIDAIPTRNGLKIAVLVAETMVIVNLIHEKQPEYFGQSKPKSYRRGGYWVSRSAAFRRHFFGDDDALEYASDDEMFGGYGSYDSDDEDGFGYRNNYDCTIM